MRLSSALFFSSRRRHTRSLRDWSSDVCSSDLTNWPAVVQKKDSHTPSTVGEDYSGSPCTGTLIAATLDHNCAVPASAGEDSSGPPCTPATGNQTTIILDL